MRNHILLVEDDLDLGLVLRQYLEFSGFKVSWFSNPLNVLQDTANWEDAELAILDVMMPEMNGFDLSTVIREHKQIPFLFLTAKAQSIDRILGLKLGADDYIAKPCEPEELLLRVRNIFKRMQGRVLEETIPIGNYSFLPAQYQIVTADKVFSMTEKESELLLLLTQNNHKVLTRKEILEKLWGQNDYFLGRSLDVFMTRIRKYFKDDERVKFDSIRGVGFKIEIPD